jgi:tetratricopeptide (TPR) repeat protein
MNDNSTPDPDPLDNIMFISIPNDFSRTIGGFTLDPKVLLPVETQGDAAQWDISDLSWEMIISAMLKILAYSPEHKDADYYRSFIFAAKPGIVDELTETAVFKAKNKDFDIAEEIFLALRGLLPENSIPELNLALVYEERASAYADIGNEELESLYTEKAFEKYKQVLSSKKAGPDAYLNAGYFYFKQHNFDKAKKCFLQYRKNGDDDKKREEVEKLIREIDSQKLLDTLFKEAYDYIRIGKEKEGIKKIKKFLETNPDVWNAWFLLGWGYRRIGDYEQGKNAFLKALESGPPHSDTYNELAICLMELEEYRESRKMLSEALKMEPENIKIISNFGILALKEGKTEEAAGFFKAALEIEPDDKIALSYLESLNKR